MPDYDLITILGPTASGKTPFAAALAHELNTEIISADSRQIYRGMDLGTGKDLADYTVDGHPIPYHLIDIADPGYKYNVFEYQRDFLISYESIKQKGCLPVLCGGTGMYLESVLKGYKLMPVPENPELRARLANHSLEELTEILKQYKTLHNSTDVDTVKRAIRAIESEDSLTGITNEMAAQGKETGSRTGVSEIEQPHHRSRYRSGTASRKDYPTVETTVGRRNGGRSKAIDRTRYFTGRLDLLRTGIQIPDVIRHRQTDLRRDVH